MCWYLIGSCWTHFITGTMESLAGLRVCIHNELDDMWSGDSSVWCACEINSFDWLPIYIVDHVASQTAI
jgi:hypothetical protein